MPDPETTQAMEGLEDAQVGLDERVSALEAKLQNDSWAGRVILRGGLPRCPVVDVLPTADEQHGYDLVVLRGAPDIMYCCLRDAAGVWDWRVVATG